MGLKCWAHSRCCTVGAGEREPRQGGLPCSWEPGWGVAVCGFSLTCRDVERREFSQLPSPRGASRSNADGSWGWEEERPPCDGPACSPDSAAPPPTSGR